MTTLKPVITGYNAEDEDNDTSLILKSCGLMPTASMMETISPWRYTAALSPNMAARKESERVELDKLVAYCRDHTGLESDVVLVEGVGGVMVPLNDKHTTLDWMAALNWPAILVSGSYLGSLNHTLTAYEVLKLRNIPIKAIIVNESEHSTVSLLDTVATLEKFIAPDVPVVKILRLQEKTEMWKQMPLISWMVNDDRPKGTV